MKSAILEFKANLQKACKKQLEKLANNVQGLDLQQMTLSSIIPGAAPDDRASSTFGIANLQNSLI